MMLRPLLIALVVWLLWRILRRLFLPGRQPGGPSTQARGRDRRYRDGNAVDAEYEELDEPPKH